MRQETISLHSVEKEKNATILYGRKKTAVNFFPFQFYALRMGKKLVTSFHVYTIATEQEKQQHFTIFLMAKSRATIHFVLYILLFIHCAHIEKSSKCMRNTHAIASYYFSIHHSEYE